MAIVVQCPSCGISSPAADSLSGRNVRCKKCGNPFVAQPTIDGASPSDTKRSQPAAADNPFPTLPAEFGRYRVLKLLGKGGMGAVYLAEDLQLGREVALKIPFFDAKESPQRAERFVREARSAAALHHPNICTVFDAGRINGTPFLTMGFVQGTPLDKAIDPDAPMPQARAAEIARKVALGLAHAHAKGIVHRDLKPANVMLDESGEPVVMDFGLAKRGVGAEPGESRVIRGGDRGEADEAKLTRDGGILGTPSYMSPEQVRGDADVGPATDVYSLGVLLFEILTGHTPYSGNMGAVMGQILAAPVPPLAESRPDADPRLNAICQTAMAKSAADRYPGMAAFAQALGEYLTASATAATVSVELVEPAAPPVVVPAPASQSVPAPTTAPFDDLMTDDTPSVRRSAKQKPTPAKGTWNAHRIGIAVGIALAALIPVVWLAGYILRVETPNGTLLVEVEDDEVEAKIKGGKLVLSGPDGKVRYTLSAGERDKKLDAGAYKIRVEGADGLALDTHEFTLKKGDKVTVRVTLAKKDVAKKPDEPKKETPTAVDPDRRASEYVLSVGGTVKVNGSETLIRDAKALPPERFTLTGVILRGSRQVTDDGLAACAGVRNLTQLDLVQTSVTDRGLAHFRDCTRLVVLDLVNSQVGNVGVSPFKNCDQLRFLWLGGTRVTDQGLAAFAGIKTLARLDLRDTDTTDKGLAAFRECRQLDYADLSGTKVTDAGVKQLEVCGGLANVRLTNARVSAKGVAALQAALPQCKITWAETTAPPPVAIVPPNLADGFVPLFNGKDLTGWKQHPDSTGRWVVENGIIVGRGKDQSHLFTESSDYTDFHIRVEAKVNATGNSGVCFRTNYFGQGRLRGNGYEANIEGDPSIRLQTGSLMHISPQGEILKQLVKPGEWFEMEVIAVGKQITIKVNGETTVNLIDPGHNYKRGHLALQQLGDKTEVHFRKVEVKELPAEPKPLAPKETGFVPLFNGKDLTGWWSTAGANSKWQVSGGAVTCTGPTDYLYTDRSDYEDFHLRAEAKINAAGNSGIYFRSGKPIVNSGTTAGHYEAQISTRADQPKTGSLFGLVKVDEVLVPPDTWFTYEVIAKGPRVQILVNGKETTEYTKTKPDAPKAGHIAFQCWKHPNAETVVTFRNVEIKEFAPEKKNAPGKNPLAAPNGAWLDIPGGTGPGKGKKIVLVAGDEEYRSEEALPSLAQILAAHHGYDCTVLFAIDPRDGTIQPGVLNYIPGLEELQDADLLILSTRFRDLPDAQMKHIVDYVESGKPLIGLRTSTHAFNLTSATYKKYSWDNKGNGYDGGFGRQVLGESWTGHHGTHGKEGTRGVIVKGQENNPILKGIEAGSIFGMTNVYSVGLPLAGTMKPLVYGEVTQSQHLGSRAVGGTKNDPMLPVAWTTSYRTATGKTAKVFTTTMGSAEDFAFEGTRRMLVNACYWATGLEDKIPSKSKVDIVGEYKPSRSRIKAPDEWKPGKKPQDMIR